MMTDVINSKTLKLALNIRQLQTLYLLICLSFHLFSTLSFFLHLVSLSDL